MALARFETRLEQNARRLRGSERIEANAVIAAMRKYSGRTRWAYANSIIYAFHAECLVPPELGVITFKRFWSGQITPPEIVDICKRYRPELLVLSSKQLSFEWQRFLDGEYLRSCTDTNHVLYIAKRLEVE